MAFDIDFINSFKKDIANVAVVEEGSNPPTWWVSTGNYVLNYIISGHPRRGYPQGRLSSLSGPSGTGKSFMVCNAGREFQAMGGDFLLVLDSENALDDDFVGKIGVNTEEGYMRIQIDTIAQTSHIVSKFLRQYRKEHDGNLLEAPKVMIVIDSLDMLMTDTEKENFEKGISKGDQGQRNKQLKAMLRSFVQAIKDLNVTMLVTSQVYKNQDVTNGEGVWIISDAVRYSLSQIILLTKLKLKDGTSSETIGIRMKAEGNKTRFARPYQTVVIEVPYETGMDPYSGLIETATALGITVKAGSRYKMANDPEGKTFFAKDVADYAETILDLIVANNCTLRVDDDNAEAAPLESTQSVKAARQANAAKKAGVVDE